MISIKKLRGICQKEAKRLSDLGIQTIDDLWETVGENLKTGVAQVAKKANIPESRLVDLLTAQALWEIERREKPWYKRAASGLVLISFLALCLGSGLLMLRTPFLITPLGSILVISLVITALALRALGAFDRFPEPLGLPKRVPVSTRALTKGSELQKTDLILARLMPSRDHFEGCQGMNALVGLTLAKDVKKGQPLRFSDVQRPQLVATGPIASGKRIVPGDVTKTLSTYDPKAACELQQVEGRRALVTIQKDAVLLRDKISTIPQEKMSATPITNQVVVSAADLAPFHPILPNSDLIALRKTPQESDITAVSPGVFTQIDEVVHRYPLQFVAKGTILEQGQLSPIQLSPDDLADLPNRQIVALRVEKGAYSAAAIPPQRITLIFSPKDSTSNQGSLSVNDVLILDVKPEADGAATFVFAATIDSAKVAPVLGNSAVFVIQPTGPS